MRPLILLLCLAALTPAAALRAQTTEPAEDPDPLFTSEDLWFAGAFVGGTVAMFPLDRYLSGVLRDSMPQNNPVLRWSADAVGNVGRPGSFVIGTTMYVAGLLSGNQRMEDLGLHGTEAVIMADLITRAIKGIAGRARPPLVGTDHPADFDPFRGIGNQDYQSFPSGHSAAAFAAAAAVTAETEQWWPEWKPVIGTVMFGGASLVALSRMYNNRHWASDVVMGAAIGSFSGWKIVRYTRTHPDNDLELWLLPAGAAAVLYSSWRARQEGEETEEVAPEPAVEPRPGSGGLVPGRISITYRYGGPALVWSLGLP